MVPQSQFKVSWPLKRGKGTAGKINQRTTLKTYKGIGFSLSKWDWLSLQKPQSFPHFQSHGCRHSQVISRLGAPWDRECSIFVFGRTLVHCQQQIFNQCSSRQRASLVAQLVKNLPAMQETWVWSLGGEDPLEKGKATHFSILAWRIPWAL